MNAESMIEVWSEIEKSGRVPNPNLGRYEHLPTKAAVIRAMHADGYSRGAIAKTLDIKYQFVRNVLMRELKRS